MAATRQDIDGWIRYAKKQDKKFIISVCDTWDYSDYPVYCKDEEELEDQKKYYRNADMQNINEVITIEEDGTVKEEI